MTQCGSCGKKGHNARTCSAFVGPTIPQLVHRLCGSCGKKGHNARTCPDAAIENSVPVPRKSRGPIKGDGICETPNCHGETWIKLEGRELCAKCYDKTPVPTPWGKKGG